MRSLVVSLAAVIVPISACCAGDMSPTTVEMAAARRWVAAKLEQTPQTQGTLPGLHVLKTYGPVTRNAHSDLPLKLGGKVYARGFYCHANSKIRVRLPGKAKSFSALVGVNSNHMTIPGRGSIVCSVHVGDKEAFRSPTLHEGMAPLPVRVELGGASEVLVEVGDAGDGISCDQSAWVDAQATLADGTTVWLGELPIIEPKPAMYSADPPFSFVFGGKPSAEFLKQWDRKQTSRKLDERRVEHTVVFSDAKTGLTARCVAVEYCDFPTVEWTLYLKNSGRADTPPIESIQALDVRLERSEGGEFTLHHHTGDNCTPDSYEPHALGLGPRAEHRFAPNGGRPTTGSFPYFNVQWPDEGVIVAIGWPGQWQARFVRDEGRELGITGGQERTRLRLHPGEEIRTPLVVLQFYSGDRLRAQNVWRRWMLAHNTPHPGGKLPPPMLSTCSGGFFPGLKCNESDELKFVETYVREKIPLTYWWMDAGWYPCGDGWPNVGTWEVDRTRFPRGLKAISDRVHAAGIKLIVWFEPERVAAGTWLTQNHPEWVLGGKGGGLLDLGNPQARAWLTDHLDKLLTEQGIDLYRQDFNIDPLPFWRANDTPDRQGMTEIRHVEGYLAYWDELRRRHPAMLIDSCASGGRRNDLETLRRAVPLLRSDYQSFDGNPAYALGNQGHTYGLALWIPYFGQGVYYHDDQLVYNVRSHFCPSFGFCYDVRKDTADWNRFRKLTDDWQAVADDLLGDFYPLLPYSLDNGAWMAWQFNRPEKDCGMIQVFRRPESPFESARFRLRGLQPTARYVVTNRDETGNTESTGLELMERGVLVTVKDRPAAAILTYHKAP